MYSAIEVIDLPAGKQRSVFHKYLEQPAEESPRDQPPALRVAPAKQTSPAPEAPKSQEPAQVAPVEHHEEEPKEEEKPHEEAEGAEEPEQAEESKEEEQPEQTEEAAEGEAAEEGEEAGEEEEHVPTTVEEFLALFGKETPFYNPHFPNTNQTKHCWSAYINYHQCTKLKGEDDTECARFLVHARSLCPDEWEATWQEEKESDKFASPYDVEEHEEHKEH